MTLLESRPPLRRRDLAGLRDAGACLLDTMQALQRRRRHVLSPLFADGLAPQQWAHYPEHDIVDAGTGYRYFYHSHPGPRARDEHGHFHLFARSPGQPKRFTHLVAVSMSPRGLPLRLFTTNRWVTDEHWQPATVVRKLVARFAVTAPSRLAAVHRWLAALVRLFRPQIDALLARRDARWRVARATRPNFFEDRRSAVLSQCRIDLSRQFAWLARLTPTPR